MTECAGAEPEPEPTEEPEPEPEPTQEAGFPAGTLLLVLAVVVIGRRGRVVLQNLPPPNRNRLRPRPEEDYGDEPDPYDDPGEGCDPYGEDGYDDEETEGQD